MDYILLLIIKKKTFTLNLNKTFAFRPKPLEEYQNSTVREKLDKKLKRSYLYKLLLVLSTLNSNVRCQRYKLLNITTITRR